MKGVYSMPAMRGLPPGRYLVRINSAVPNPGSERNLGGVPPGPSGVVPNIERIAPDYNVNSRTFIEVTRDGNARFDFDVRSLSQRPSGQPHDRP